MAKKKTVPSKKKQPATKSADESGKAGAYKQIIAKIFSDHYSDGDESFHFHRDEIAHAATALGVETPKNLGDVIYSFRFRTRLPASITARSPEGREWIIVGVGDAQYQFRLFKVSRVVPSASAYQIKIPDSTPEIINMYAKTDEQALLAKVRYNRLIDVFLRAAAHSLQNHLRTKVPSIGQIEIDELYVGVRNTGQQFIIPVQAKGGNDQIAVTQVLQDLEFCRYAFPSLTPRAIAVQFIATTVIAMFELTIQEDELRVVDEKHYRLVEGKEISDEDLSTMANHSD